MTWPVAGIREIGLGTEQDGFDVPGWLGGFKLGGALKRTISFVIDWLLVFVLPAFIAARLSSNTPARTQTVCDSLGYCHYVTSGGSRNYATWGLLAALILFVINIGVLNGRTGQSIGKKLTGLHLARPIVAFEIGPCFAYVGTARAMARVLLHSLDILTLGYGFLRGAWHPRRQTFADSILGTVVIDGPVTLLAVDGMKI
jgi:uncharacterized RDD family membrane protein YckC